MKKVYALLLGLLVVFSGFGQRLLTWTPEFPNDNSALNIVVDATKGSKGLLNYEGGASQNVYVHVGVITNLSTGPGDWKYVPFAWGVANTAAKATPLGNNKYQFNIANIRQFFNVPATETIRYVTVIFRSATGSLKQVNSDGSDMYIPINPTGSFNARLTLPPREPRYVPWAEPINIAVGSQLPIQAVASANANIIIRLDGVQVGAVANDVVLNVSPTISTSCDHQITMEATSGGTTKRDTINFFIASTTQTVALPAGMQDGINYNSNTEVTLVLYAPGKTRAVVKGDFNNWTPGCASMMSRTPDGNRFWVKLTGLTPSQIYRFQYVVDDTITTTDPYTELVLDPWNDQYIPANTYSNMPAYPTGLTTGMVGTFQTAAPAYNWSNNSYSRPDKKQLVIYELLMRDFTAAQNWQTVIDSLNYLKNLGINAIQLMPFTEFDGNNSWGYNPAFFFAPDKAYGSKAQLKRFIDSAHSKGMAVILDAVFNHVTGASPLAQLYWNGSTNKPAANNPWLNQDAPHPFSVYNDFNHTSEATKYHVARFIRHWLTEYKLDGFRWDLSKGFTQRNCGGDVGCWNQFDQDRVNIWQRYMDSSQAVSPNSYMILEHLGNDDEEGNLANRGFLLWGIMNTQYNQNTMGFNTNSDINRAYFGNRTGWSQPHLVTYAESHDEERIMYRNLNFGNNSQAAHNVRQLSIALKRTEAMQPFLLLIPGPKMIWQFGELGYDKSIFTCENGTVPTPYGNDQCKTAPKPVLWSYNADPARKKIYNVIAKLNWLRQQKPMAFVNGSIGGYLGTDLKKVLTISHADLKVAAVTNFDVVSQTITVTFPSAETYYELFDGSTFNANGSAQTVTLGPGEYKVWTNMAPCQASAPTATTTYTYCQGQTANQLTATGNNLKWYTTATGGTGATTAPTPSTATAGTTTYYVSQTTTCESPRTAITVTVNAAPAAPTVPSATINYCQGQTATQLSATGTNLKWYTTATGGTAATTAPTPTTTAVGTTSYYVSQSTGSCESPRTSIAVTVAAPPAAPTVTSPVNYCQGATATALTATGSNLKWYTTATGGTGSTTAPTPSTATVGTTTFYVSQTTGCESPRAAIVVNINAAPGAPSAPSPITYCQGQAATPLTATGANLKWYTTATGGTGSATAPTPATTTIGSTSYWVSQSSNGCEGPRVEVVVNVTNSTGAPTVTTPINYCQGQTATALTAIGTNLKWYTVATGGTASTTAPTPSTTSAGSTTYYVSQTTSCGEGPRAAIVVNVVALPAAPAVATPVNYCQGATAAALSATGTNLMWYTTLTGGTGSSTAPTPSTSTTGSTTYYVSQANGGCESPRAAIVVNVNAVPSAPTATSPITYCQGQTATALSAAGVNLKWYTTATGGIGSATAPTPSTATVGSTSYWVSQTVNGCESNRTEIVVNITTSTPAPTVSTPVNYCQGQTATALTAIGTNLKWYTVATGGTASTTAPTPSTATAGPTTYYVSQTTSCGEGPRAAITVNVTAIPAAPAVTTPINYCQGSTAAALSATGTNLMWYTTATGGTGTSTAPTPSTATTGSTTYYVSQANGGCESPRAAIVVIVNVVPSAPSAPSPITYCQGQAATALSATGTNLKWYTTASGGTGSATAPTPATTTIGSTSYWVSQTSTGCESNRTEIVVNVVTSTPAPTVTSPINYCQGQTSAALTATGSSLLWYTAATGGSGSTTAPTPSTATAGSTIYYVSQTTSCGEGPRAAITVNVTTIPAAPVVSSPVVYCEGASATALTATGNNLTWYTVATGGTGSATAPTPATSSVGSTTYYVSQSNGSCEGPRAAIVVNINATPPAPTVTASVSYCQGATASQLTATGSNLLWYTAATGGTGSTSAPTPSTATAGETTYYVSQSNGNCESPRSAIKVMVNATPAAPTVTSPISYCLNATATALSASGNGLLWYTTATGGTGSATAPIPSTNTVGGTSYFVSQSNTCGEGPRAEVVVNVVSGPAAPTGLTATNVSNNSATLGWSAVSGSYFLIEYRKTGVTAWTSVGAATNATSVVVSNLEQGMAYEWRVTALCDQNGTTGNVSSIATFSTSTRNTSIANIKNGIGIKISPSPVLTNAILDYIVPGSGKVNIGVYNTQGRLVGKLLEANQAAGQYSLDVSGKMNKLAKSIYIIRIEQDKKTNFVKFMKY